MLYGVETETLKNLSRDCLEPRRLSRGLHHWYIVHIILEHTVAYYVTYASLRYCFGVNKRGIKIIAVRKDSRTLHYHSNVHDRLEEAVTEQQKDYVTSPSHQGHGVIELSIFHTVCPLQLYNLNNHTTSHGSKT